MRRIVPASFIGGLSACLLVLGCSTSSDDALRYRETDHLFRAVERNVQRSPFLHKIVEIDHARLAAASGEEMPPSRVILFSNPDLEARLLGHSQLAGIDLPLRVLSCEDEPTQQAGLLCNQFDYLAWRHGLDSELAAEYNVSMSAAFDGVAPDKISVLEGQSETTGIVTVESEFGFEETVRRVRLAIESQGDTVWFGTLDFAGEAAERGVALRPTRLLLFGGPAPGARAMRHAPALGLDAFCQKLLVWEDEHGHVQVSFNDLVVLAYRIDAKQSPALRLINDRMNQTFSDAIRRP